MSEPAALSPEDGALFDRIAQWLVVRRLGVPAVLFLESTKPLSFVGSQALYFFEPMVKAVFANANPGRFATLLEDRQNVEELLRRIEAEEARAQDRKPPS